MLDTQRQMDSLNQQNAQITAEQQRIRDNMKTVAQNSEYYNRLLKKLNDQESLIEKHQGEISELKAKVETQRHELEAYLAKTNVGA